MSSHGSRPSKYAIDFDERIYAPQPTVFVILLLFINLARLLPQKWTFGDDRLEFPGRTKLGIIVLNKK